MTQEEIIEMAEKTGVAFASEEYPDIWQTYMHVGKKELKAFAKLIAEKEREACAKICDEANKRFQDLWKRFEYEIDMGAELGTYQCAKAIRERGQA